MGKTGAYGTEQTRNPWVLEDFPLWMKETLVSDTELHNEQETPFLRQDTKLL